MKFRINALIALASVAVFALLYIAGILTPLELRIYDFFLRFRANRQRVDSVVFVDVDDAAVKHYGISPLPRSVIADGLLRLREFNVKAAIFDIEYTDRDPQSIDRVYLEQGLEKDFLDSFSEIGRSAAVLFSAVKTGTANRTNIERYEKSFQELLETERKKLYAKAQNVARDNDRYLAQTMALLGDTWGTINLRVSPLEGEQAQRRSIAEEKFAYYAEAASGLNYGKDFVDVLPVMPVFAEAVKGAGFTNVEADSDGIRRRVYLFQNVFGCWYAQLALAPLLDYLGRPDAVLEKNKLILRQAKLPDGRVKDLVIPLDNKGRMMLDWPREDFNNSYAHVSFAVFSQLDAIEAELELYSRALASSRLAFFADFDDALIAAPGALNEIITLFDAALEAKAHAIETRSMDSFNAYLEYRKTAYSLLAEILAPDVEELLLVISDLLCDEFPEDAEKNKKDAEDIAGLANALTLIFKTHAELMGFCERELGGKFAIIGRTDAGTDDIGANPFFKEYIKAGTHGAVMDTILSGAFIIPLHFWWQILFMFVFVMLFFIISAKFAPVKRAFCGLGAAFLFFIAAAVLFRFSGFFLGPMGTVFAMLGAIIAREITSYTLFS